MSSKEVDIPELLSFTKNPREKKRQLQSTDNYIIYETSHTENNIHSPLNIIQRNKNFGSSKK